VPIVLKSGSLSLLEPSGPVKAFNGISLPLLRNCQAILYCSNFSPFGAETQRGPWTYHS
jgi:hypothetical protein